MSSSNFVLPEKWAINRNQHNHKIINDWFNKKTGRAGDYYMDSCYVHYPAYRKNYHSSVEIKDGYTEITFEQFQEHVLGLKTTPSVPVSNLHKFPKEGYCKADFRIVDILKSLGYIECYYEDKPTLAWYWNKVSNKPDALRTLDKEPTFYGKAYSIAELLSFNNKTNKNELQTTSSETRDRETGRIFRSFGSDSKSLIRGNISTKQETFGRTQARLKEYRVRGELFLS